MLYLKLNHMCESTNYSLRRNMLKRDMGYPQFLFVYVSIDDSTSFILYLMAPVEAIDLMIMSNYFYRTPTNSKRRNHKDMVFSKHFRHPPLLQRWHQMMVCFLYGSNNCILMMGPGMLMLDWMLENVIGIRTSSLETLKFSSFERIWEREGRGSF